MKNFFVDLHSHAHQKAYSHSFKKTGPTYHNSEHASDKNSSWWRDWPTGKDLRKNVRGLFGLTQFTQADVRTCIEGNVGVVFSSLYPLESPFTKPWNGTGVIADKLLNMVTGFGIPRIDHVQAMEDYFVDLENEYHFQLEHHNKVKAFEGRRYRYSFVKDFAELEAGLNRSEEDIKELFIINSIEGAHALGTGLKPFRLEDSMEIILKRIDILKNHWEYPPFFITLAHHFYNEICGHARSLGVTGLFLNQRKGLNEGFTPEGREVVRHLLNTTNGRRIHIDLKHMSLKARKEYYTLLEEEYDNTIPVLVSHGCVTGYSDKVNGKNVASAIPVDADQHFRTDDINFYDFELVKIGKTQGLFGIQLDERRISGKSARKALKRAKPQEVPFVASKMVWNQIQHIAEVLDAHGLPAWSIQSLGTDFDGIVDPIDGFFTAAHFKNLYELLLGHAEQYIQNEMPTRIKNVFNHLSAKEIIDAFVRENAMRFLSVHFKSSVAEIA